MDGWMDGVLVLVICGSDFLSARKADPSTSDFTGVVAWAVNEILLPTPSPQ
jgi:hypothetical protein